MSLLRQQVPWGQLAFEGTVIVVSILLAFAIDAWWDGRQEADLQIERLAGVAVELQANSEKILEKIDRLEITTSAASTFLSWMGPEPEVVEFEAYKTQWNRLIAVGSFSLIRSATEDFLASGTMASSQTDEIRRSLAEWYFYGDELQNQYDRLREAHANLADYGHSLSGVPVLHTLSEFAVMQDHPRSKFPFDQNVVLADPVFESLLAIYLMRMEFVSAQVASYQERQNRLLSLINSAIENGL